MSMKNFNYTIGNRTRDLPACNTVPQPNNQPDFLFLVNGQPDAQILFYIFISIYNSLHVSSTSCSSSGETNCINTASGNSHSMLVAEMCAGWKKTVFFQPAHISATNIERLLPEAALIQFVSPDDEHCVLETCREL